MNGVEEVPPKASAAEASRVSVVITTYNRADLIGRAVSSVLRQTYEDVELIVVDDGSTDDTPQVLVQIARNSERPVRYLRKANGGCASARNVGGFQATGRWLTFLDSDDELERSALKTLVSVLSTTGADFAYSPALEVDARGVEVLNEPVAAGRPDHLAAEHFCSTNIRTGSYLLRSELFSSLRGFNESYSHNEDSDFVQRMAIEARGAYSPVPSVRCHLHEGGKSRNRVAIHQALLASSEATLARYPAFVASIGRLGQRRIAELRSGLVDALILAGRMDEAAAHSGRAGWHISPVSRIALLLRTKLPVRLLYGLRHALHFLPDVPRSHRPTTQRVET